MKRRSFLKVVGGMTGGLALGAQPVFSAETDKSNAVEKVEGLPRRALGRTGAKVSIVGFPGLALMHYDQAKCTEGLHSVFERGLNYFDVAPAYGKEGECEIKMGIGLQGMDRDKYFLACKTNKRDKEGARLELERSLQRLKTDHFDLYQLHHLRTPAEVKQALGPDGAMDVILKARDAGKIKHIGFSAHTTKGALEALRGFKFDTVMFPINFVEYYSIGFAKEVIELANQQGVGLIAIKHMSLGTWPKDMQKSRQWWYRTAESVKEVDLATRFSLSQPGVAAGITPSFLDLVDRAIEAAKNYRPITAPELEELKELAKNSGSVFKAEEDRVAMGRPIHMALYPDSPYECMHMHG